MPVTILVGAQWGDEGKGRVVDWLAERSNLVARYAGGDNAGHTVQVGDDTFKLHLIPSGILRPGVTCVLGHGMVINPQRFLEEIEQLNQRHIDTSPDRLLISERAHIITHGHIALDTASEADRGDDAIGTTQRGIGPAYTDKVRRQGLQAGLLRDPKRFGEAVQQHLVALGQVIDTDPTPYERYAELVAPHVVNITPIIHKAISTGQQVLCEGAQGTLLDIDMGHYPFVTSSNPSAGGALTGLGIGPTHVDRVIGVAKAYSTRVGAGPMPTELHDASGDQLREAGHEYGTTTGRPRRCGWLDMVALRYAAQVNGLTELVVTKLDVLSGFETLNIAVAYEIDGQRTKTMPSSTVDMEKAMPVYQTLSGWQDDITDARQWDDLPKAARQYLETIMNMLDIKLAFIGVGPERSQIIVL